MRNTKRFGVIFLAVLILFLGTGPETVFAHRPPRCVTGDPTLNIWFHSSPIDPGKAGSIAMNIGNGDSDLCPDSRFKFSVNMPNNWRATNQPAQPVLIPATGNSEPNTQVQIDFRVPPQAQLGIRPFVVTVKNKRTNRAVHKNIFIKIGGTPVIETMTPTSGPAGTHVTLVGRNFGSLPELGFQNNTDGQLYIRNVPSNGSRYEFIVPSQISMYSCGCRGTTTPGVYSVLLGNTGTYSNVVNFTVTQ